MDEIAGWKHENVLFEPSCSYAISTRSHQCFDVVLGDLGLTPYQASSPRGPARPLPRGPDHSG